MRYVSTRGAAVPEGFADILLSGLASDGGLIVPQAWPQFGAETIAAFRGASYADIAFQVLRPFVDGDFSDAELRADIHDAYAPFDHPSIAPLTELVGDRYILELFHGPTCAFKDIAMQLLARFFSRVLTKRAQRITVLVATSGDTGAAAVSALGGMANIELFVLHPKGHISDVQRRQMTTAVSANVHNIAVEGTFDDAQAIVKTLLSDATFVRDKGITAVNSINLVRIVAQAVYYFASAAKLDMPAVFAVPTGNFGDAFAAEAAMRMGLPIRRIVVATNENANLAGALEDGIYGSPGVKHTLSPAMDIQVASNFERALYQATNGDTAWIANAMRAFGAQKKLVLPLQILARLHELYSAASITDEETLACIGRVYEEYGRIVDPHTAVAIAATEKIHPTGPVVMLSTAHPAKFPDAIRRACGVEPELPPQLRAVFDREERCETLPASADAVRAFIARRV